MTHVSQDRLLAFAAGRADAGEAERLFEHLDACAACGDRFEAIRRIREDFDGSWDAFLDEWRHRMEALEGPSAAEAPFAGMELALRGILDEGRRLATAAVERVSGTLAGLGALEGAFRPAYSGVADPTAGRAQDLARRASELYGEGREDDALRSLEEAAGLDPRAAGAARVALEAGNRPVGEIVVDARRRSVSVLVDLGEGAADGYALLIHGSGKIPEIRCDLHPVPGARYHLAEFENVPTGPFTVRLRLQ
jgi:anti-sigma factor RsiW